MKYSFSVSVMAAAWYLLTPIIDFLYTIWNSIVRILLVGT